MNFESNRWFHFRLQIFQSATVGIWKVPWRNKVSSFPLDTWRRFVVYKTSIRRRIDVETTAYVCWDFIAMCFASDIYDAMLYFVVIVMINMCLLFFFFIYLFFVFKYWNLIKRLLKFQRDLTTNVQSVCSYILLWFMLYTPWR